MIPPILEARKIVKTFPGVVALKEVSFDLVPGEIHALCGENGAGKSTLIKLLSGLHPFATYEGELRIHGQTAELHSLADAQKQGIAVIYQELALVDELTVGENIFLGNEPRSRFGLIDWKHVHHEARRLLRRFKVDIDSRTQVAKLGVGQKQLVEIVKALSKNSKILILDEPTAALAEHEVRILLEILRELRRSGIACIYISHKLEEVFAISDRITVIRDGISVGTLQTHATNQAEIIKHMVGREIHDLFPRRSTSTGQIVLRVQNLTVRNPHTDKTFLKQINLTLKQGEVLGIGGLMGAGRSELLMHLFGIWGHRIEGRVQLLDLELTTETPDQILRRGMALVSEDRRRYGLILDRTIAFNLSLSSLGKLTRNHFIQANLESNRNEQLFRSLRVKAPSLDSVVGKLSGGNQQKIVIGKVLMTEPNVIFLDEPTRGIDVGAKLEIYEIINRLTESGKAVILVSSELPELMGMSDRILMLHNGSVGGEFSRDEATPERLLSAAMGQSQLKTA